VAAPWLQSCYCGAPQVQHIPTETHSSTHLHLAVGLPLPLLPLHSFISSPSSLLLHLHLLLLLLALISILSSTIIVTGIPCCQQVIRIFLWLCLKGSTVLQAGLGLCSSSRPGAAAAKQAKQAQVASASAAQQRWDVSTAGWT
jgi:hypothetical protein